MLNKKAVSSMKRIAILITCHNRKEKTLSCLRALKAQRLPDGVILNVFLVNDGCSDGTCEAVLAEFPSVCVLEGDGYLYWCGGMRLAWSEAMKGDYDGYLWLNDDTLLMPGAIELMLLTASEVYMKESKCGIIVGSCCDPETGEHTYGGRIKRNRNSRLPDQLLAPGDRALLCDTMNGNLVLVPREVACVLGNLSHEFIHAFGDVDYGNRARQKGFPIWICPGYQGYCKRNDEVKPWTDPHVSLRKRWINFCSPLGLPPLQWYVYVKRHTGSKWPIYFFKPIFRVLFPSIWGDYKKSFISVEKGGVK